MNDFKVEILTSGLTPEQKFAVKHYTSMDKIEVGMVLDVVNYAKAHVTNSASDSKEYDIYVFFLADGRAVYTSSEAFYNNFTTLLEDSEDIERIAVRIAVVSKRSKQNANRTYLTANFVSFIKEPIAHDSDNLVAVNSNPFC